MTGKSTLGHEFGRVPISSKQPVPDGDIGKIEFMNVKLMMDGMKLGGLDKIAHPGRGFEIGVIKTFASSREEVIPECAEHRTAKHRIQDERA